jgi:hypothetical protein
MTKLPKNKSQSQERRPKKKANEQNNSSTTLAISEINETQSDEIDKEMAMLTLLDEKRRISEEVKHGIVDGRIAVLRKGIIRKMSKSSPTKKGKHNQSSSMAKKT